MPSANVRRRGTGDPEATFESRIGEAQRASYLWATRRRGRQKFRRFSEDLVTPQAFADPRLACAVVENCPDLVAGTFSISLWHFQK